VTVGDAAPAVQIDRRPRRPDRLWAPSSPSGLLMLQPDFVTSGYVDGASGW